MASRLITDLRNVAGMACAKHLDALRAQGINYIVTCTLRTNEEQESLYKIGRTTPGKRVTNAKAGQSAHNYGLAWDIAIMINGKLNWDLSHPHWQLAGKIGESIDGVEWLGNPASKFKEGAHFQLKDWKSYIK